ncbi:MAG: hypothetical protein ACK55I_43255, partial [bacterium]
PGAGHRFREAGRHRRLHPREDHARRTLVRGSEPVSERHAPLRRPLRTPEQAASRHRRVAGEVDLVEDHDPLAQRRLEREAFATGTAGLRHEIQPQRAAGQ